MHWYVAWYSWTRKARWNELRASLLARYPNLPVGFPEGAHTLQSSCLHLIVNWLEIETSSQFLGQKKAVDLAAASFVFRQLYEIVLADWDALSTLYEEYALLPIPAAHLMTVEDLAIAQRMDESTVDG